MRKVILIIMALSLMFAPLSMASDAVYERIKLDETIGWSISGSDDDIDAAYELITELDTTFAQLAAEDSLEVVSASAADITQSVTISGIDDDGNKNSETIALDTTAGTTAITSVLTWRYVDQVTVDAECAGAITVRRATGDTFITSIPIGSLDATMIQHFNGEQDTYITGWRASVTTTTGTVIFELREYPDDADCLDAGDGYRVLDSIALTNVLSTQDRPFNQPIKCSAGGWICVYAIGGAANSDGTVTLQGYDTRQ